MSEGNQRRPERVTNVDGIRREDFLYHLYRGSTLLLQDDVHSAKEELEQALALQPQDAKSQDLLAGVYFRLGVYPRAITIWKQLTAAFPDDPTLRVNLGLALFKTGQSEAALDHVREALRIQPNHARAWGYLGLIHWRRHELAEARDAFLRGGQASMARRMQEALEEESGSFEATPSHHPPRRPMRTMPGISRTSIPLPRETFSTLPAPSASEAVINEEAELAAHARAAEDALAAEGRQAMRDAAEAALQRIEVEGDFAMADPGRTESEVPAGSWSTHSPGEAVVPERRAILGPRVGISAPLLDDIVAAWSLGAPDGSALVLGPEGRLVVQSQNDVFIRLDGLAAVRGDLRASVVRRHSGGQDLAEPLGEKEPVMHVRGPFAALYEPPAGREFVLVRLGRDALYVREHVLFGFDDAVRVESARLSLAEEPVSFAQLSGDGVVVMVLERRPAAVSVDEGQELRVDPARLAGWVGRLFPSAARGTAPYAALAPQLTFRGTGAVLLC